MTKPKKVAVLLGGTSSEREVSLKTGKEVSLALRENGFQVEEIDPADPSFIEHLQKFNPDVVFIALHGRFGEDGTIQGLLEILGYPYTGSSVLASSLAMNKIMTKKILSYEGINTAPFQPVTRDDLEAKGLKRVSVEIVEKLGLPVVVKPACQGSTIGVTIVHKKDEVEQALELAFRYDDSVLAEAYIEGTEVTASVLGTKTLRVLPLIEIVSETGFYDYEAKYSPGLSHHIIPARIAPEVAREVELLAEKAFRALNCRHFARVDFMISKEGIPYVLEVNTVPGMTPMSLFPDAARAAGISFQDLVSLLVEEAYNSPK
ncbi:MAG: D-alanine--D-alanine ligase [Thermoanaerobacterales bacterium 50_218]|nr:MAG: D-alanine--D-alanine ligase [Thermoanaerobacterales bacterium 50_218]HAA90147.1 D-alanine--D-alanine ligase [Peptococcaceae bacterium]